MEQELARYAEKYHNMKEKTKKTKFVIAEKWKLLKDVKFKEKEIFKIKKEIS